MATALQTYAASAQEATTLALSPKQIQACALWAEGEMTDHEIAAKLKVSRSTLVDWKRKPDVVAKVAELVKQAEAEITYLAIARKLERTKARNDRWQRGHQVIEQRAEMYRDVPGGGDTGLLVRQVRLVKVMDERDYDAYGEDGPPRAPKFTEIEEYAVDTGLLKELSDLETAVERSLGQSDAVDTGAGIQRLYIGVQVNLV